MNIGDKISDYIIERLLGEGGMATVYLARHEVLDQQVAIKILDAEVARKPGVRERFIQEANIQARLKHPHVIPVLTATKTDTGTPALIMEYMNGESLSQVLQRRGTLPVDDAIKIMEQVLSAVGYAHRQGVIHRDLKPSNMMVMASGEAKVTDFGIAKVLGSSKLTRTGTAMGSAHYMSPEQIRRPETVDARSDIYSLGCVFYEVLTGRPPFGEKDASGTESDYEVKTAHVTEVVPALETVNSSIPAWLAKLVMSMLEKEPANRPSSCEAILAEIEKPSKKPYVSKTVVPKPDDEPQAANAEITENATRAIEPIDQLEHDRQLALDWQRRQRLKAMERIEENKRAEERRRNQEASEYIRIQKEAERKRQVEKQRQTFSVIILVAISAIILCFFI